VTSWGESSGSTWDETTVPDGYGYSEVKKPPKWPLILQISIVFISALLYRVGNSIFLTQKLALSIVGYLLTPFLVVLFLALLRTIDLKNRSLPWYDRGLGKIYIKWSGRLCLLSFALAVPILWRLAIEIVN
jgi:hypothetical protein